MTSKTLSGRRCRSCPRGLLNTLQADEVLDLMAYLLSRGDRRNAMFGGN